NVVKMAKLLGAFIAVDLYFFACDLLTSGFPQGAGAELVKMLTAGPLAAFFWIEVIGCIIAAVICFVPSLRKNGLLVFAAVLAIIGIFCKRVQLLVGGFQQPNIDLPTVVTPYTSTANTVGNLVYWPTGIEWMVTLGVIGLAAALLCFGLDRICKK
ncbi:MAG: polysulfide reductase NrfD, partial [Eggerthellaceae bacterium]|nr:polysulfide reductase NrfD [Eggerthellaceae bacterium]